MVFERLGINNSENVPKWLLREEVNCVPKACFATLQSQTHSQDKPSQVLVSQSTQCFGSDVPHMTDLL